MKKQLTALLLTVLLAVSLIPASAAGGHFTDVPAAHWAHSYVERAYSDGAISGTGGDPAKGTGVFSPNSNMTYGQFLTMLMSAFYPEEMAAATVRTPWYAPAIQVASSRQLTYLSQDDLMNKYAGASINRYNAAYVIVKVLEDKGSHMPDEQAREAAARNIGDWETVGTDAKAWPYYVSTVVAAGVMSGVDSSGTFDGGGRITRASAAVIYASLANKVKSPNSSQTTDIRQEYKLVYGAGWDLITEPGYRENLERAFYETYPRVVARWGDQVTQKTVSIGVKPTLAINDDSNAFMWTGYVRFDGARRVWERNIEIAAASQETRPSWALTHELTHVVQNYNEFKSTWWVESMACYGHLRYCCWADPYFFDIDNYFQVDEESQRNWNFEAYGGRLFFAYMDSKYPTTPQGYGLIDSIHYAIRAGEITSDDPGNPTFNAVVKRVTGLDTIEQLRQQYVRELDGGTWTFNGFAGYRDNYITENLPGVPNPTYPTAESFNLCAGAYTYAVTGEASAKTAGSNLIDGDQDTRWEAAGKDITDGSKNHSLCITLGKAVTFDTYTLYHAGSQGGDSQQNTVSWKLRYYDSQAEKWKLLDEVKGNDQDVTVRTVTPVNAQNLWLEILNPSGTGDGTVRLYELELYRKG